jgi:hypothetical protein
MASCVTAALPQTVGSAITANCGHCGDYACEKLEAFFGFVPDARTTLDGVRTGLTA